MKCPKCGSDLDTGFNCTKCDYKHNQKQLSTAEKLIVVKTDMKEIPQTCKHCRLCLKNFYGSNYCGAGFAYEVVKCVDVMQAVEEKTRPKNCPLIEIKEVKE